MCLRRGKDIAIGTPPKHGDRPLPGGYLALALPSTILMRRRRRESAAAACRCMSRPVRPSHCSDQRNGRAPDEVVAGLVRPTHGSMSLTIDGVGHDLPAVDRGIVSGEARGDLTAVLNEAGPSGEGRPSKIDLILAAFNMSRRCRACRQLAGTCPRPEQMWRSRAR